MGKLPEMVPVADLRHNAAAVLKRVKTLKQPLIITQRGRPAAVMFSVEAYERAEYERELLRALARGEREIRAGEGQDLESVLAEADALLSADRR